MVWPFTKKKQRKSQSNSERTTPPATNVIFPTGVVGLSDMSNIAVGHFGNRPRGQSGHNTNGSSRNVSNQNMNETQLSNERASRDVLVYGDSKDDAPKNNDLSANGQLEVGQNIQSESDYDNELVGYSDSETETSTETNSWLSSPTMDPDDITFFDKKMQREEQKAVDLQAPRVNWKGTKDDEKVVSKPLVGKGSNPSKRDANAVKQNDRLLLENVGGKKKDEMEMTEKKLYLKRVIDNYDEIAELFLQTLRVYTLQEVDGVLPQRPRSISQNSQSIREDVIGPPRTSRSSQLYRDVMNIPAIPNLQNFGRDDLEDQASRKWDDQENLRTMWAENDREEELSTSTQVRNDPPDMKRDQSTNVDNRYGRG